MRYLCGFMNKRALEYFGLYDPDTRPIEVRIAERMAASTFRAPAVDNAKYTTITTESIDSCFLLINALSLYPGFPETEQAKHDILQAKIYIREKKYDLARAFLRKASAYFRAAKSFDPGDALARSLVGPLVSILNAVAQNGIDNLIASKPASARVFKTRGASVQKVAPRQKGFKEAIVENMEVQSRRFNDYRARGEPETMAQSMEWLQYYINTGEYHKDDRWIPTDYEIESMKQDDKDWDPPSDWLHD